MRVNLTISELRTDSGVQLLDMCRQITADGKLDLQEIITLRKWLRAKCDNRDVAAIPYLSDIMTRITADSVISREEQLELHLAIERVIPPGHRTAAIQARKNLEAARQDRQRELQRVEKEKEAEERRRLRQEEYARARRLRHEFAKVAGVTFPNDDGSERQEIIARCAIGERLDFHHDPQNPFSAFATRVLRTTGEQLGHAPEYLAERIVERADDGYSAIGTITDLTGGVFDKPTRGVNFAIFFYDKTVSWDELNAYARVVLASQS